MIERSPVRLALKSQKITVRKCMYGMVVIIYLACYKWTCLVVKHVMSMAHKNANGLEMEKLPQIVLSVTQRNPRKIIRAIRESIQLILP